MAGLADRLPALHGAVGLGYEGGQALLLLGHHSHPNVDVVRTRVQPCRHAQGVIRQGQARGSFAGI